MYDRGVADENYLRGVQPTASDGSVTFTSIFPACYSGRWPHIHFEVYRSVAEATAAGQILATSQLALPQETCSAVYATTGYEQSVSNLARVSLDRDMVFGDDGGVSQLATMTGDVTRGYTAALTVGI
jgi:protocatechuate 3,4-dioxygenase beta subunit